MHIPWPLDHHSEFLPIDNPFPEHLIKHRNQCSSSLRFRWLILRFRWLLLLKYRIVVIHKISEFRELCIMQQILQSCIHPQWIKLILHQNFLHVVLLASAVKIWNAKWYLHNLV